MGVVAVEAAPVVAVVAAGSVDEDMVDGTAADEVAGRGAPTGADDSGADEPAPVGPAADWTAAPDEVVTDVDTADSEDPGAADADIDPAAGGDVDVEVDSDVDAAVDAVDEVDATMVDGTMLGVPEVDGSTRPP